VEHDVLIPGSEVLAALSDGRFGHERGNPIVGQGTRFIKKHIE
jgi:hypothetical protein